MIKIEQLLHEIFFFDKNEVKRDPNDPSDQPFFSVKPAIEAQAYHSWLTENGGEVVLNDLKSSIRSQIVGVIEMPIRSFDDVFKFLSLRQHVADDLNWYIRLVDGFEKHEERKQASLEAKA